MTRCCQWFTIYDAKRTCHFCLGNDFPCAIKGVGNIKIKFKQEPTFTLNNICHVLELRKILILIGQLDDEGYIYVYGDNSWKINKGSMVVARGATLRTLYMLHVIGVEDHVVCVTKQPSLSLQNCQLGHMFISRMETLSCLGFVPSFNF